MTLIKPPGQISQNNIPSLCIYECGQTIADFYFREKPIISKYLRICYIISGKGFITVEGISYEIQSGDTYIIPPGSHYYYNSDPKNPMNKLWLHFSGTLIKELLNFYQLNGKVILLKNAVSYEIMDKIHKSCLKYNDFFALQSETNMYLFKLLEVLAQTLFENKTHSEITDALKTYIDINTTKNIAINKLTDISNLSKDHTTRIFKQKTGCTPHQYMLNRKIELAKFCLKATDYSIDQIASELGFCDGAHFSYAFTQRVGLRPSKFRKAEIQLRDSGL